MRRIFRNKWLLVALLLIAPLFTYLYTLENGFVYDDNAQILANYYIKDFKNIPRVFSSSVWSFEDIFCNKDYYYRPMMYLVYMGEYHFWKYNPSYYHLVNIILHSLNTLSIFFLIKKILEVNQRHLSLKTNKDETILKISSLVALIWSVHPINSETVNWIAALPELLLMFFFLWSFYFYILFQRQKKNYYLLLSFLFFGGALFSKETAVMIPFVFLSYYLLFVEKNWGGGLKMILVKGAKDNCFYFLLLIAYFFWRWRLLGTIFFEAKGSFFYLLLLSYINSPDILLQNILSFLWPSKLSLFHDYQFNSSRAFLFSSFIFILLISHKLIKKKTREIFPTFKFKINNFYWLSFFMVSIPLIPALNPYLGNLVLSERYLYLPSLGLALFFSLGVLEVHQRIPEGNLRVAKGVMIFIVFIVVISVFIIKQRNNQWKDDYTIYLSATKTDPLAPRAHENLGFYYCSIGQIEKCEEEFKKAQELNITTGKDREKSEVFYNYNLGRAYLNQGNREKAARHLNPGLPGYSSCPGIYSRIGDLIRENNLKEE